MPQEKGYLIREIIKNLKKLLFSRSTLVDVNQTVQSTETYIFTYHFCTLINKGKKLLELLQSYFLCENSLSTFFLFFTIWMILVNYYCLFFTSFSASQLSLTDPRNASKTRSRSVANSDSGQSAQSYQAELLRSYLEQVKNYTFPHQGCSHE